MSKSPYYDVEIKSSGRNISDLISSFTYEDCTEEDDMVRFTMTDIDKEFIDNPDFVKGAELLVQFGYIGYKIRTKTTAVIQKIERRYGKTINLTVVALDKGFQYKKSSSNKIWKNLTSSEIVEQIAKRYNMTLKSNPTKKKHKNLPQGNLSDFDFIKYLTKIEDDGSYIFYIRDQDCYFIKRDLTKNSFIKFSYGDPQSKIIDFVVNEQDDKKNKAKHQTSVSFIDPMTGEEKTVQVDPDNVKSDGVTGTYEVGKTGVVSNEIIVKNAQGKLVKKNESEVSWLDNLFGFNKENTTGDNVDQPVSSEEEARNVASKKQKESALNEITASLTTEGDTLLLADEILTIEGVAQKDSGNWYIKKVTHSIQSGGYTCVSDLCRNGTKKPTSTNSAPTDKEVNNSVGDKDPQNLKKTYTVKGSNGKVIEN